MNEDCGVKEQLIIGYWSYYEEQSRNNQRFFCSDFGTNENACKKYNDLYEQGKKQGVDFISLDQINDFSAVDAFLFSDIPKSGSSLARKAYAAGKPMFLIIDESEIVYPPNWNFKNHEPFEKVFTWNDDVVDGKKYLKSNHYFFETKVVERDLSHKKKLCVMIAAHKKSTHPLELYTERERAIRWFEHYHPDEFDLFGFGWDEWVVPMDIPIINKLNGRRGKLARKILASRFPSWRGTVKLKKPVLREYWFSICYENARDIPGYILEKIFDCFFAGTVPIYRGADNIQDYIPAGCFVDQRDFKTYEQLYDFIKSISLNDYISYLDNIEKFLNSEKAYEFSSEHFSEVILGELRESLSSIKERV